MELSMFVLVAFAVFKCTGKIPKDNIQYKYRFVVVDAVKPEEYPSVGVPPGNKRIIVKTVQDNFQLSKLKQQKYVPRAIQNLFAALDGFQADHCLLVIDNWQGVNIKQTSAMPVLLRKLEQAFYDRKIKLNNYFDFDYFDAVLMPINVLNSNYTFSAYSLSEDKYHHCPVSRFYYPLTARKFNADHCVDLNHDKFILKSKPWQCEIQVSLLIQEHMLKNHNFPGIFKYNYDFKFYFLPSSRPNIHVIFDVKTIHDIGLKELLAWTSHKKLFEQFLHRPLFKNNYYAQNNVHLSATVVCRGNQSTHMFDRTCHVLGFTWINLCLDCDKYTVLTPVNQNALSFEYLTSDDKRADSLWYGETNCPPDNKIVGLCKQIEYFQRTKHRIIAPLTNLHKIKSRYLDSVQILAWSFTSLFTHLLGNHSIVDSPKWNYLTPRSVVLADSIYELFINVALHFQNKFGSLRFVSCGARGFEYLQINQFVAIFENRIWTCILIVAILLTITMNVLTGSMCLRLNSLDKVVCLIMLVLEQGNPLPERFIRSRPFRFLICGTLLGGLVLSNAFKSENVYNIVLPRSPLKFAVIDELLAHGYSVYSKLAWIGFIFENFGDRVLTTEAFIDQYDLSKRLCIFTKEGNLLAAGDVEVQSYMWTNDPPENIRKEVKRLILNLMKNSGPHLGLNDIIVESVKRFYSLDVNHARKSEHQLFEEYHQKDLLSGITVDFWKRQNQFIADDLQKCNKTAWILPDYQAQQLTRLLHQSGKHSDVGVDSYFKPYFDFNLEGPVPSFLIQRFSLIHSSGLLEWWSDLINRTDLVRRRESEPPVKPKMSGNIQILFLILPAGMSVATGFMIFELHQYIIRVLNAAWFLLVIALRRIVDMF